MQALDAERDPTTLLVLGVCFQVVVLRKSSTSVSSSNALSKPPIAASPE